VSTAVELRRYFNVTPEKVFDAFADARLVARWLKPSPEIELSVLHFDFREGGGYRFAYHVPNAAAPMIVFGAYSTIRPPLRIVFSWMIEPPDEHAGIQSEVSIEISREGARTALLIRHDKLTRPGAPPRHAHGWQGALAQLSALMQSE
jgi:uncharacterized protein YndB with AHSA1/START domain